VSTNDLNSAAGDGAPKTVVRYERPASSGE
jgi:hypothetical protein